MVAPNGAASCAACSLGALAGRKALLLPWVTLLSEGKNLGTAMTAITQAAITTQRNLTANAPIPPKMAWMRTGTAYWLAPVLSLRGLPGNVAARHAADLMTCGVPRRKLPSVID